VKQPPKPDSYEFRNHKIGASMLHSALSECREDRLDIGFVNDGRKTLLKSPELKSAASANPDFKFPHAPRTSRKIAASSHK